MGILNVTADSFYEGFLNKTNAWILDKAAQMIQDGADILDIGGQSTKPGSERIDAATEISRVLPIIKAIHEQFPEQLISIDTYHSAVAIAAIEAGACIVNDISGGSMDKAMIETVAQLKVPYNCMHIQGTPENMQENPQYENITGEVLDYFTAKITACTLAGIHDIIIDPGFGFGKTVTHNFQLLKNITVLNSLGKPILVGLSRKSMVYNTLGTTAAEALNGTTALHMAALLNGVSILRVHDVKAAAETVQLFQAYSKA